MNGAEALTGLEAIGATPVVFVTPQRIEPPPTEGFGSIIAQGLEALEGRIAHADAMVRAFATDSSVPIHEVTIALEEARLAVELALQVRTRVVEAYRELMTMQL